MISVKKEYSKIKDSVSYEDYEETCKSIIESLKNEVIDNKDKFIEIVKRINSIDDIESCDNEKLKEVFYSSVLDNYNEFIDTFKLIAIQVISAKPMNSGKTIIIDKNELRQCHKKNKINSRSSQQNQWNQQNRNSKSYQQSRNNQQSRLSQRSQCNQRSQNSQQSRLSQRSQQSQWNRNNQQSQQNRSSKNYQQSSQQSKQNRQSQQSQQNLSSQQSQWNQQNRNSKSYQQSKQSQSNQQSQWNRSNQQSNQQSQSSQLTNNMTIIPIKTFNGYTDFDVNVMRKIKFISLDKTHQQCPPEKYFKYKSKWLRQFLNEVVCDPKAVKYFEDTNWIDTYRGDPNRFCKIRTVKGGARFMLSWYSFRMDKNKKVTTKFNRMRMLTHKSYIDIIRDLRDEQSKLPTRIRSVDVLIGILKCYPKINLMVEKKLTNNFKNELSIALDTDHSIMRDLPPTGLTPSDYFAINGLVKMVYNGDTDKEVELITKYCEFLNRVKVDNLANEVKVDNLVNEVNKVNEVKVDNLVNEIKVDKVKK
jgi:hypothetical protein